MVKRERADEPPADNPLAVWLRQQEHRPGVPPRGSWAAEENEASGADATEPLGPPDGQAGASRSELWDLEPEAPRRPRRPRSRLVMLAALPWVLAVFLAIGLWSGADGRSTPAAAGAVTATSPATPRPLPTASPVRDPERSPDDAAVRDVAALAVRSALSGPALGAEGSHGAQRARFVEDAVATGLEPAGDMLVVTVSALVLEGGPNGWDTASVRRYAVPVRISPQGPEAASAPWPIADRPSTPHGSSSPEADPAVVEAVRAALGLAGYRDLRAVTVSRDPALAGVLLAHVEATGPGEAGAGVWDVWLRDTPEPAVLGDNPSLDPAAPSLTPPVEAEDPT